jgi:hypothetical protein
MKGGPDSHLFRPAPIASGSLDFIGSLRSSLVGRRWQTIALQQICADIFFSTLE